MATEPIDVALDPPANNAAPPLAKNATPPTTTTAPAMAPIIAGGTPLSLAGAASSAAAGVPGSTRWDAMHMAAEVLPADELAPRGQGVHARLAGALLYVSAGQTAHGAFPAPVLCAPAGQATQTCPLRPAKPGLQAQPSSAPPAAAKFECRGQQVADPGINLVPAAHGAAHTTPTGHARHTSRCGSAPACMLAVSAAICAGVSRASTA